MLRLLRKLSNIYYRIRVFDFAEFLVYAKKIAPIYRIWLRRNHRPKIASELEYNPLISVIMPVYNSDVELLKEAIESVENQTYSNWQLCIVDDASTKGEVKLLLREKARDNPKIKIAFLEKNSHISICSNKALELATGEFVALLDHDDLLSKDALYCVCERLNEDRLLDLIYSDEDLIDVKGRRFGSYLKSEWDMLLFLSQNMFSHLGILRRSLVEKVGGFRDGYEGSQDYDLVLRCLTHTDRVAHIARVLYHWRVTETSASSGNVAKSYTATARQKALIDYLHKSGGGLVSKPVACKFRDTSIINLAVAKELPKVVIFITSEAMRHEVIAKTNYPNYQLNMFNVEINLAETDAEYILVIKDNMQIKNTSYIQEMLYLAALDGTGMVGGKVSFHKGDRIILHAGFSFIGGKALNLYRNYHGQLMTERYIDIACNDIFMFKKSKLGDYVITDELESTIEISCAFLKLGYRNALCAHAEMLVGMEYLEKYNLYSNFYKTTNHSELAENWQSLFNKQECHSPHLDEKFNLKW